MRSEIDQFKAADSAKMLPEGTILFVGSSSIREWHPRLEKDFRKREVIGRGFGGSTMQWLLYYFDEIVTPYKPSIIVVYEGDNDLARSDDVEVVTKRFDEFIRRVSEQLPGTSIAFIPPKPSVARWNRRPIQEKLNAHLIEVAADNKTIWYIDIATPMLNSAKRPGQPPSKDLFVEDGLHLSDKGYDLWAKIVQETLKQIEAQ